MKKLSTKGAKNKAWKLFSEWVRRKNADGAGYVKCFTCQNVKHWKEMNAGHFKHNRLDFDEINLNPQCVNCNKWNSGRLDVYSMKLIEKYGLKLVEDLVRRSFEPEQKRDCGYYLNIINIYKKKLEGLS